MTMYLSITSNFVLNAGSESTDTGIETSSLGSNKSAKLSKPTPEKQLRAIQGKC